MTDGALLAGMPGYGTARLVATKEELAALGIVIDPPFGAVDYDLDAAGNAVAEIGTVAVRRTGIVASPRWGLTIEQEAELVGLAEAAVWTPPRRKDGWHYAGSVWRCWVFSVLPDDHPMTGLVKTGVVSARARDATGAGCDKPSRTRPQGRHRGRGCDRDASL
ncbi:hypothetical protein [Nocardia transvalensis]|uniref:hypothetical protein n=1 Tax=Nocardia transvalensis TaxID=37333 RepID=UPI001895C117|nr:hypothetical protein [Nocardia transvalensis]MBF6328764.1 hypothetical protein [Nocardia transvalensis]